jgi:spoIIIJ-associated protein
MPSYQEFEGKDVDDAAEKASKKLKITKDNLKYDVISYGSTGIFGLVGTKKARIRVAVMAKETPPADEGPSETAAEAVSEAKTDTTDAQKDEDVMAAIQAGQAALQKIVDQITDGAAITLEEGSERIKFNIQGENAAILIGKRGQTLEAIQYLIEKIVNRQHPDRIRVRVDIEGYMENKKNNLKQLAARMAKKAKESGKPASVGQMNAHDRRIVHLALKNDDGVRTQSMGEGLYRKLVIFPKKGASKKQKNR